MILSNQNFLLSMLCGFSQINSALLNLEI
jgi:hypothetical protein